MRLNANAELQSPMRSEPMPVPTASKSIMLPVMSMPMAETSSLMMATPLMTATP